MAPSTRAAARRAPRVTDIESDYGSDLDEAAISDLLVRTDSQSLNQVDTLVLESLGGLDSLPVEARTSGSNALPDLRKRSWQRVQQDEAAAAVFNTAPLHEASIEVEYDECDNRADFIPRYAPENERQRSVSAQPDQPDQPEADDKRSPLERFRTTPKKPMSVTDIISPAWCELQYWYSLTKYGKVKKTPAMKKGSSVHKVLEEQVHTSVPVDVVSREDGFGLRIWNIIQGLRTLRATGMTRELEVWGVIEGQVVNGVIDEVSFACPDEELEERVESAGVGKTKKAKPLPSNQTTMNSFLANGSTNDSETMENGWLGTSHAPARKVYLTDVKTRGSRTAPKSEVSLRPTQMQLMMYHRLLGLLSSNSVPGEKVFERYRMDSAATFSDTFIAQIGGLDFNFHSSAGDEQLAPFESTQDSVGELLFHNCLSKLWELMMGEFAKTLPTIDGVAPMGNILRAEFRAASTGQIIGVHAFAYDAQRLDAYILQEMAWWKGDRPAKGVDVEEAFKCRICEFSSVCTWRKEKVEEGLQRAKLRQDSRRSEA